MEQVQEKQAGRGANSNPKNRFERLEILVDDEAHQEDRPRLRTRFYDDASESIITYNSSPDIPFDASLNPYRGCEHGCAYCYARPTHEYLGFSAGLDFESKILVKRRAPELLKKALSASKWKPQLVAMSGVTDPYQPVERQLSLTRSCLEVLLDFRNPVGIVTKNRLVARDADLLAEMASLDLCNVSVSLTTLNAELARVMEPRTSSPKGRLETISTLASAGVPVGIMIAPVIPGLNDHEIPAILKAAKEAGASFATYILLRLPHGVKDVFFDWMDQAYPSQRNKVEGRLRELRGGQLNRTEFGERFSGKGIFADQIRQLFQVSLRREGLSSESPTVKTSHFRRAESPQMEWEF
ncbi:PA0069 family radical SAM protein [Pelagicoccus sp. SDUM812002]|uniref:PA0069 family radical SAM protein n=1 Tax=Pelagicoccus sp. SDUM812002 TaxID=3041266 RepID=UPI00280D27ED|nr:PA0069 family radical SAM protein [Pelagicoccus sp. SDUM812002]MDQ8187939.1 PA0069 family radical SAM protein [Pelagicoccus sp. SDUM812002]